jgi:RNA polymerase sigma factor (sigma-70 family)
MSITVTYQPLPAAKHIRLSAENITELVGAALAGEERAWNALVAEFGSMIWAVARAHRLRDADASEVSQATWLRLLEHLGKLTDPTRVGAWLATTARRECLRVLRESQRCGLYGDDAPERVSPEMAPDDVALLRDRDDALWRSFSSLRASDQALLRLLLADPRPSYEEIAAALDMPIGSIGPTRQRALERLRSELRREGTLGLLID